MPHMTYTTLIGDKATEGSVRNWVNDALIPASQVIHEAEQFIYQRLRVREMIIEQTGTYGSSDSGVLTLDTAYRSPILLQFTGVNRVFPKHKLLDFVSTQFGYDSAGVRITGTPQYWATNATQIVFEVFADKTFNFQLLYHGSLAALASTSNETNFLTDRYPRLFRTILMGIAYEWQEDDKRAVQYLTKGEALIFETEVEKDLELTGADLAVQVPGTDYGHGYGSGYY